MPGLEKRHPALTIAVIAVAAIIGAVVSRAFVGRLLQQFQNASVEQRLVATALDVNKQCPRVVDPETRLDRTTAGPGRVFTYQYTLVNLSKADLNPDAVAAALRPEILKVWKTNPALKFFRDNGVTVHHRYSDKKGVFVSEVVVTPNDLK